jgi:hypothetical protein
VIEELAVKKPFLISQIEKKSGLERFYDLNFKKEYTEKL